MEFYFPCENGWDSQGTHDGYSVDIGCVGKANCDVYAVADGTIEFEGFYSQVFKISGVLKTYRPIGVIIRHTQFSNEYDYLSIYWHLASTCIDKGNTVKAGQKIGVRGNTGYSLGTHLHFQVLKVKKGAEVPNQHYPYKSSPWTKKENGIDPIPLFRLHDGQTFVYKGNWYQDIKKASNLDKLIVARDTTKHQVQITGDIVNARKSASTNGEKIDYLPLGIYNVYETTVADKYTWYRVGTDVWFAFSEDWAIDYQADTTDSKYEELEKKYKELEDKYSTLYETYEAREKVYQELLTKYSELQKTNTSLEQSITNLKDKIKKAKEVLE